MLFIVPDNPPINCTNTTFDPRTVTLEWTEPERALQNGEISGYDLQCLMDGSDIPVPNVDDAQDNPDTNYTIPVLTPFTSYGCLLAAINEIGTGPNTTCVFMTAQDSKYNNCRFGKWCYLSFLPCHFKIHPFCKTVLQIAIMLQY